MVGIHTLTANISS